VASRGGLSLEGGSVSQRFVMRWQERPLTVLIVARHEKRHSLRTVQEMGAWIAARGMTVVLEPKLLEEWPVVTGVIHGLRTFSDNETLLNSIDLVVTIGGDGTLTWAASLFNGPMPPVLSFAAGSLGFLTPFPLEKWKHTLSWIFAAVEPDGAPVPLVCRMRLCVKVRRGPHGCDDREAKQDLSRAELCCLNEVLVHRGRSNMLAKLDVRVDGERVTLVQGDGIILATPTGSTAYSLACGGSMVHPAVPGMLLTPVAPHSLSFRPALLPDSAEVIVIVPLSARAGVNMSLDGKDICGLQVGDSVHIAMSSHPVPAICRETDSKDWFASVNEALQWNRRVEQKS
jgi:NAD+ kinase